MKKSIKTAAKTKQELVAENETLRRRLEESEETLNAIRSGEVDAFLVSGPRGDQVYTLQGADRTYREMLESIHEGAATLDGDGAILYCNKGFAKILKKPLEQIIGTPLLAHVPQSEHLVVGALLGLNGKAETNLQCADETLAPVYLSANMLTQESGQSVTCIIAADLSDQKRDATIIAEGKLANLILAQAMAAVIICDEKGTIIKASNAVYELCGHNPLHKHFDAVFPLITTAGEPFTIVTSLHTPVIQNIDAELRSDDGRIHTLIFSSSQLIANSDTLFGCVVTLTDITARREAEDALSISEIRFRQLAESLPQLIWTCRADGPCDYLSPQWIAYTGIPEAEQLGLSWLQQLHPDDRDQTVEAWNAAIGAGSLFEIEFRIRRHDGIYRWFKTRAVPMHDAAGRVTKWFGTNTDIEDYKQAEQELRESRDDLSRAQSVGTIGSWRLNVQRNELFWSEENHRIFGIPQGAPLTYETFLGIVHPEDREYVHRKWTAALYGEPYDIEHRIVVGDTVRCVRERAELEYNKKGLLLGGFGTTQDITERKEAENKLIWLASFPELNPNPIAEVSLDSGEVVYANPTARHLFPDLERSGSEHPFLSGILSIAEDMHMRGGSNIRRDVTIGECCYHQSFSFSPRQDRIRVYAIDITERKRAEEALVAARSEAERGKRRLEAVMETLPVGVAILDERGGNIQSNIMFEQIWGKHHPSTQTITDYSAYKAWFADTGKPVQPEEWGSARAVTQGETVIGQVMQIERFDGTRAFIANSAVPIADSNGTIRGCAVAIMDITEIKHTEQRLDLLAETASSLLKSDSPQTVVESLCAKVMDFLDCHAFFNFLADAATSRLHLNAWAGIPDEEARRIEWLDYGVAVCGCAARDGSRIVAEDIMNTPDIRTELVKSYGIQAYACHPLISQGEVLGTLSFGTRTRTCFSDDDLELMKAVADQVAIAMERKRAEKQIEATNRRLRDEINQHQRTMEVLQRTQYAVDNAGVGIFWIGPDSRILYVNNLGAQWVGYSREEITGMSVSDINPDHPPDIWIAHWKELAEKGTMLFQTRLRRRNGTCFPVEISANYLTYGAMKYNCAFVRDITEHKKAEEQLRNALRENEVLMNEIHHRVKNNMQVIVGMLSLQAEGVEHEGFRGIIENCKNRISTMALVHEKLFRLGKLAEIDMREYLTELVRSLYDIYHKDLRQIELEADIPPLRLQVRTVIPLGLVVNEILANSFKHAFPDNRQGRILLKLHGGDQQEVSLEVGDDGVGMTESHDMNKPASLGLRLIRGIVQHQLQGSLDVDHTCGTRYRIRFRVDNEQ